MGLTVRENPDNTLFTSSSVSLESFVVPFFLSMTSFQSVFWSSLYFLLTLLFARYLPFTYTFSCSLSRSFRILPILGFFLTFFRVFLNLSYAFYFLLSLVALSLSFQLIFNQNHFPTNLNYINFLWLTKH